MRLIVVALLGIEITIIALASAASAAAHPDGRPAASSSPYETDSGPATVVENDSGTMGPQPSRPGLLDWSSHDQAWLLEDMRAPQAPPEQAAPAQERTWTHAAQRPPQARPAERRRHKAKARTGKAGTGKAGTGQARIGRARTGQARIDRSLKNRAAVEHMRIPIRTGVVRTPLGRPGSAHKRSLVDLTRVVPRQAAIRMSHTTATGWLKSAGLRTQSTGNCTSKHMRHCTSLDKVRTGTIARVIALKQQSRCPIMVTGGTESGHAPGHYSHGNGYKLDISHNRCIDRYITKNHRKAGVRSDGARLYRSRSGTTFADESDHWDILFR